MKKLNKSLNVTQGFTIVELMITLVILSIVLAFGIPSFQGTIEDGRLVSQTNQTTGALAFARSEAAKRPNTTITMCGSSDTTNTTPTCNTSNWENGWFIMSDANGDRILNDAGEDLNNDGILDPGEDINGNGVLDDAPDQLLLIGHPITNGNTLRTAGFSSNAAVQFNSTGTPDSTGTFILCDSRGTAEAKAIVISISGQTRLAVDSDGDGIVNNHAGVNVTCP